MGVGATKQAVATEQAPHRICSGVDISDVPFHGTSVELDAGTWHACQMKALHKT